MSHIVSIAVEVRDLNAVKSACCRLELVEPVFGKAELFQRDLEGILVRLPDWVFPVVCDLPSGKIHYDNSNGYADASFNPRTREGCDQKYPVLPIVLSALKIGIF